MTRLQDVIRENKDKNVEIAGTLISLGADILVREEVTAITPLMHAAQNRNIRLFVQLVEHNGKLGEKDAKSKTVWDYIGTKKKKQKKFFAAVNKLQNQYPKAVQKIKKWQQKKGKMKKVRFNDEVSNKNDQGVDTKAELKQ